MAEIFYTYQQISEEFIETHWSLNNHTFLQKESTKLKGWQKNEDIFISVEIYITNNEVNKLIRQDRTASFYLSYYSKSERGGTSIHDFIAKKEYDETQGTLTFTGKIAGQLVAGIVEISLSLCIDGIKECVNISNNENLTLASDIGSVLFETKKTVILEGEQSYFPIADIDFSEKDFSPSALYFLQRNYTTLETDFGTAYRLYFNNKHPQFLKINDANLSESKDYLLNMIVYDVYKELIFNALDDENFTIPTKEEYEENPHSVRSVFGVLLKNLLKQCFDNMSLDELRKIAHSDDNKTHNKFICSLQSYLLTFGD